MAWNTSTPSAAIRFPAPPASAVLDVIRDEELQQNALEVGEYLKRELSLLQARHRLVGDVRGLGLFLGIELVRDRDTLEPAGREATQIVERMKERGILTEHGRTVSQRH